MGRRVVIIAGIPGCSCKAVVDTLRGWGYASTWPGQDCDVYLGNNCRLRGENLAVRELHDSILYEKRTNWFTDRSPKYYNIPHPGPDGVLDKFPEHQDVVLADPMFCFFLPMWHGRYTDLIVCNWQEDVATVSVEKWSGKGREDCLGVIRHYRERLESHTAREPVASLSHEEARSGDCVRLEKEFKNQFLDR